MVPEGFYRKLTTQLQITLVFSVPLTPFLSLSLCFCQLFLIQTCRESLWSFRMRKWRNRLLHQDLKVSVSSPVNLLRPSRAGSLRRMPGSQRTSRREMEMMNAWGNPTVAWRPGKICPSYTETFPEGWCPPHWRTWTSSTPIRRWVCIYISQVHKGTARGPKHHPEDWDLKSYSNLRKNVTERHGKKLYRCFWNWKHVK